MENSPVQKNSKYDTKNFISDIITTTEKKTSCAICIIHGMANTYWQM